MQVIETLIPEVKLVRPARHADHRGFFSETFSRRALAQAGIDRDWVQDNHSLSRTRGTVRGLHFQVPPHAQAKLVRVLRGRGAGCGGRPAPWRAQLRAARGDGAGCPIGRAAVHPGGFCARLLHARAGHRESPTRSAPITKPSHDRALHWDDPALAIDWPDCADAALLSARDRVAPLLHEIAPWAPDLLQAERMLEAAHAP